MIRLPRTQLLVAFIANANHIFFANAFTSSSSVLSIPPTNIKFASTVRPSCLSTSGVIFGCHYSYSTQVRWLAPQNNRLDTTCLWATAKNTNSNATTEATPQSSPSSLSASPSSIPKKKKVRKTQLLSDLKEYRLQQANQINKPAYNVFTNVALQEIYARLPTTQEELLEIKGIGPKKLEQFGDDILAIVRHYCTANGELRTVDSTSSSSSSATATTTPTITRSVPRQPRGISAQSLTLEQQQVVQRLLSPSAQQGHQQGPVNGFVTGSAGTGKSYVLKYLVQEFQRSGKKVGVCAPTGVAAINVGGSTLHSFFGIGLVGTSGNNSGHSNLVKKVLKNEPAVKRIEETQVLIIDECSMLSSDLLELLDALVRSVRLEGQFAHLPFGGMQVICFGDFFQLPPIAKSDYYNNNNNDNIKPFCFDSPIWKELGMTDNMLELREVQRQEKTEFVDFLNKVRVGDITQHDIQQLNQRCVIGPHHPLPTDGIVPTRLYSHNKDVDGENEARLAELDGKEEVFQAQNSWKEPLPRGTPALVKKVMADSLSKEMPDEVRLKVGAQVMLTRNKDLERNLVNGSRGVVLRFERSKQDDIMVVPVVRFDCGVIMSVTPVESVRYNPDGGPGSLVRSQIPLKLAWALTVHKSQGTTLSRALLDISSAFEFGQCYVALSRVQSLEGLWLVKPARSHNIKVSPQVLDFYSRNRNRLTQ